MAEAFNPDKFLAQTAPVAQRVSPAVSESAQGFDPDKFLNETAAPKSGKWLDLSKSNDEIKKQIQAPLLSGDSHGQDLANQATAKALDYPGGHLRTGLASLAGLAAGKDVGNKADWQKAAQGEAPRSAEYLERLGVSPGPRVRDIPYLGGLINSLAPSVGETSARDAEGFGLDVVTDPLTMLARAGKLNPVGDAVESAGKKTYKSGLKKIDAKLVEAGDKPVSDVLLEHGAPTGTTKQLAAKADEIGKSLLDKRQKIYSSVEQLGDQSLVKPDFVKAQKEIDHLKYVGADEAAESAQKILDGYKARQGVPVSQASAMKSNLYMNFKPETRAALGKFKNALGLDFKTSIEDAAENYAGRGKGADISAINQNLGSLIEGEAPMAKQIAQADAKAAVTPTDAALAMWDAKVEAAKKAAEMLNLTIAKTKAGKGLITAGKSGVAQGLVNRGLLNNGQGLIFVSPSGEIKAAGE